MRDISQRLRGDFATRSKRWRDMRSCEFHSPEWREQFGREIGQAFNRWVD